MDWEDRHFDKRLGSWDWGYEAPRSRCLYEVHVMGGCNSNTCRYCEEEMVEEGRPV